jgi:hypothetical protein
MKKITLTVLINFLFLYNGFCQQPSEAELDKMMKELKNINQLT